MALPQALPQVYDELRNRQKIVGRISLVEFDDEEYQQLRSWAQTILDHYDGLTIERQRDARIIFLAFACEYVRRKKTTHDNVFWDDFNKELQNLDKQGFICDALLWPVYKEEGIEQKWGAQNRLIVESLLFEVNASEANKKSCIDFFCWYYQRYGEGQEVTPELLHRYNQDTKSPLGIHEKAFSRFNRDIQLLSRIVEYTSEHNISLTKESPNNYREIISDEMGEEYDINTIAFIRNGSRLRELFLRLQNNATPSRFLQLLAKSPNSSVSTPSNDVLSAKKAYRYWKSRWFPYGRYKIDQVQYCIVPQEWLSLDAIASWPYDTLVTDLRSGFVAYKKHREFEVTIGLRKVPGHKCYADSQFFIWLGIAPKGEPFFIDGRYYPLGEGIDWHLSLHLHLREEQPALQLVFNTLKVFFPVSRQEQFVIRGSQDQYWSGHLNFDGQLRRCRSIVLPIQLDTEPVTMTFYLGDQYLDTYMFRPEPAYLFSVRTWERIPPGSKLSWGERHYFLLSHPVEQLSYAPEVIQVEQMQTNDGHYLLYGITWEDPTRPFSLVVGNLTWSFQQRHTIAIETAPCVVGPFHLARHQMFSFTKSSLTIYCTMALEQMKASCQIFCQDELLVKKELQECAVSTSQECLYRFSHDFLEEVDWLISSRDKGLRYGHYDLLLVNEEEQLLDIATLALIPKPHLITSLKDLTLEGCPWDLIFSSPDMPLWDASCGKALSTITLRLFPHLQAQMWGVKVLPKGIVSLVAETFKRSLVFPSLGETIEAELTPVVFGFRFYQKEQVGHSYTPYRKIVTLDYYALEKTALVVHTRVNTLVKLQIKDTVAWSGRSDADGFLLEENLQFLREYVEAELTSISLLCEGVTGTITLCWRPCIFSCSLSGGIFSGEIQGPTSTRIRLSLYTIRNETIASYYIPCQGVRSTVSVDISSVLPSTLCYVVLSYMLSGGTQLLAAQQLRINTLKQRDEAITFLEENLQLGIGFSDASLMAALMERLTGE